MTLEEKRPTDFCAGSREGLKDYEHYNHSTTLKSPVNIAITVEGKIAGYIRGDSFHKRVIGSKHQLRKLPAWSISKAAFCEQILPNTQQLIVEDIEVGVAYHCSTELFARHCFEIQRGSFEPQLALTLNYWERQDNGHRQLGLWEGGESNA